MKCSKKATQTYGAFCDKWFVFFCKILYNGCNWKGGDPVIKKGIPQEGLKLIACLSMLIDHAAAIFEFGLKWRAIGRLAFPIYCFLLVEGMYHTRDPKKYALRLAISAVISEFAFDFAFYGRCLWQHQNVMLTLLLGVLALEAMKRCPNLLLKLCVAIPFALIADILNTDYRGYGVLLVWLFGIARELPCKWPVLVIGMTALFCIVPGARPVIMGIPVPLQLFGLASLVFIALYSGEKLTKSKAAQWGFYLFYPVHMVLLRLVWLIFRLL